MLQNESILINYGEFFVTLCHVLTKAVSRHDPTSHANIFLDESGGCPTFGRLQGKKAGRALLRELRSIWIYGKHQD
jgi:hypothetical protein